MWFCFIAYAFPIRKAQLWRETKRDLITMGLYGFGTNLFWCICVGCIVLNLCIMGIPHQRVHWAEFSVSGRNTARNPWLKDDFYFNTILPCMLSLEEWWPPNGSLGFLPPIWLSLDRGFALLAYLGRHLVLWVKPPPFGENKCYHCFSYDLSELLPRKMGETPTISKESPLRP